MSRLNQHTCDTDEKLVVAVADRIAVVIRARGRHHVGDHIARVTTDTCTSLKLQRLHEAEMSSMEMVVDGVLAIQAGAGPRMLAERLRSFLPPAQREAVAAGRSSRQAEEQAEAA